MLRWVVVVWTRVGPGFCHVTCAETEFVTGAQLHLAFVISFI